MILTEIGEIGVHVGDHCYRLRPSLYAMSKLGSPSEIVSLFANVMGDPLTKVHQHSQFRDALEVIHACTEEDVTEVFGYYNERFKYVLKKADPAHIIPLARCLLKHGVIGALPPLPVKSDEDREYTAEFVARDHVAVAMAHLGVSEAEAWNMTMTSLVGALRAKFPQAESDSPGAKAPTIEEAEAALDWHDKVLEKRKKRLSA
ncbi:DUF6246 family protein [Ectopseudomonas mendocina]|uniref:DUF6246 family protein n=1 Tax=Ectopseudomonas mendocina TaxID=300 RepID=A0ABZ2RD42_ECTME